MFLFLFLPLYALGAGVVINEVAWMGMAPKNGESSRAAANNEWIELYNSGSAAVSLEGWKIVAEDGAPDITLEGSIPSGGYFLLERGSDDIIPEIKADLVYPFKNNALENSGERLLLKDSSGAVIDEVDASAGWPAGDNETKETMQRSNSGWITAAATPKAENFVHLSEREAGKDSSAGSISQSSGASGSAPEPQETIKVYAGEDKVAVAGAEVAFVGSAFGADGKPLKRARFLWNFGDGEIKEGRSVVHIYRFPGEYLAGLHVSSGSSAASHYLKVKIIPNQIEISGVLWGREGWIRLRNDSEYELDLGGWFLQDSAGKRFVIPSMTKIASRSKLALANAVTGLNVSAGSGGGVYLYYPNGKLAADYAAEPGAGGSGTKVSDEKLQAPPQEKSGVKSSQPAARFSASAAASETALEPTAKVVKEEMFDASEAGRGASQKESREFASAAQAQAQSAHPRLFFWLAVGVSFLASVGFIAVRKFNV